MHPNPVAAIKFYKKTKLPDFFTLRNFILPKWLHINAEVSVKVIILTLKLLYLSYEFNTLLIGYFYFVVVSFKISWITFIASTGYRTYIYIWGIGNKEKSTRWWTCRIFAYEMPTDYNSINISDWFDLDNELAHTNIYIYIFEIWQIITIC